MELWKKKKKNSDHHGDVWEKRGTNTDRDVIITFLFIIFIMTVIMRGLWLNSILLVNFCGEENNYLLSDIKIRVERFLDGAASASWAKGPAFYNRKEEKVTTNYTLGDNMVVHFKHVKITHKFKWFMWISFFDHSTDTTKD